MPSIPKSAHTVAKDDVIVRHPDHPNRRVELTVTATPVYNDVDEVMIDYLDADGGIGRLRLSPVTKVEVRVPPREALVADLRRMADYLEGHPELPVGEYEGADFQYGVSGYNGHDQSDAQARIEVVRRAAEVMGVEMAVSEHNDDTHYVAEIRFGFSRYKVAAIIPTEDGSTTS